MSSRKRAAVWMLVVFSAFLPSLGVYSQTAGFAGNPAADIGLASGRIIVASDTGFLARSAKLIAREIRLEVACPRGQILRGLRGSIPSENVDLARDFAGAEETASIEYQNLPLASTDFLRSFCRPYQDAIYDRTGAVAFELFVICRDSAGDDHETENEAVLPVNIECDERTSSVVRRTPSSFRHVCPAGFVIEGTDRGEEERPDDWSDPAVCIREEP